MKEDVWVHSVEHCIQVKEDEKRLGANACHHPQVICDPDQSCFHAVAGVETRLEFPKQVVLFCFK